MFRSDSAILAANRRGHLSAHFVAETGVGSMSSGAPVLGITRQLENQRLENAAFNELSLWLKGRASRAISNGHAKGGPISVIEMCVETNPWSLPKILIFFRLRVDYCITGLKTRGDCCNRLVRAGAHVY